MDAANADAFAKGMIEDASTRITDADLVDELTIDASVHLPDVNWDLLDVLEKFEPFGEDNPKPLIACQGMVITELQPVGKEGKHLRIVVNHVVPEPRKFIAFGGGAKYGQLLSVGDKIDAVFTIDRNEWNGTRELQLKVVDLKLSDET